MKERILKNWRVITLVILSAVFFVLYSWYPNQVARETNFKFASPDETANYFWTRQYAVGEELFYFEPLNLIANDAVVPRSMRSDNGLVKPVSFLGIILIYGVIAKILGSWIIIYLTPVFAVIGVLCLYGIIRRIFSENIAMLSALTLFIFAPYWYYASRSMFHNVLFIDLLLAGVYLFICHCESEGRGNPVVSRGRHPLALVIASGIFFGLAIITRTSELIWLAPAMLIVWLAYVKQIDWRKLILFLGGIFLALMPMFYYNQTLYGGALNFGYNKGESRSFSPPSLEEGMGVAGIDGNPPLTSIIKQKSLDRIKHFVAPFGFHPRAVWYNFINYYIKIFWYLFWPALLGGLLYLWKWKEKNKAQKLYFIIFIVTSVMLGAYYGSWAIQDSIALNAITIGNSYARYWLPMYILSLPLAAEFVFWLITFLSFSRSRKDDYCHSRPVSWHGINYSGNPDINVNRHEIPAFAGMTVLVILFFMLNFQTAVFGKDEGLYYTAKNIALDQARAAQVLTLTEDDAVVATKYFDKYFFPARKVISTDLSEAAKNEALAALSQNAAPLYYYGFIFPPQDLDFLNNKKLAEFGFVIEPVKLDEEAKLGLYKIKNNKAR